MPRLSQYEPRGLDFTRACIALAKGGGNSTLAADIAARDFSDKVASFIEKGAVSAASTQTANWGGAISDSVGMEFIGLVNELSVFGQIVARKVPINVKLSGFTTGGTAYWRQEGAAAPVTAMALNGDALPPLAVTALCVLSKELIHTGAPGADVFIRDELVRSVAKRVDLDFLDPTNSGTSDIKPASITNGVSPIAAGTDVAADLRALVANFTGDLTRAAFIARPEIFAAIQSFEHPNVGLRGGELLGAPAYASRWAPAQSLILLDTDGIAVADGGAEVEMSEHASLQMADNPSAPAQMVSLWQNGLVGFLVRRTVNWAAMRPSVSYLSGVQYEEVSA